MHRLVLAVVLPVVLGCGGLLYDETRFDDIGTVVCDGVEVQVRNERHLRTFPHLDTVHRPHLLVTLDGATEAHRMGIRFERFPHDWPPNHPRKVAGSPVTWSDEPLHNLKDEVQIDMGLPPGNPVADAASQCGQDSFDAFRKLFAQHPALEQRRDFRHLWWFGGVDGPVFRGPEGEISVSVGALVLWPAEPSALMPEGRRTLLDPEMRSFARVVGEVERVADDRWVVVPEEDFTLAQLAQYVDEQGVDLVSAYGLELDGAGAQP